eukprot:PhF_6_TR27839/c1_g1_i1/m.40623/K14455/GOT2; aspartate aminotransferase, mitochondrial
MRRSLSRFFVSPFAQVPMGPPDAILGLSVDFNNDTHPNKVNLGVGAYRDDNGKPVVLKCVQEAEKRVLALNNHEYAPIQGIDSYIKEAQKLALGSKSSLLAAKRAASIQCLSGTGSLRVGAEFLKRFYPKKIVYQPNPTWGNHVPVFKDCGFEVRQYTYYNPSTCGLNEDRLLDDLSKAEEGSVVLLHACAHNPTGVDPTVEQWQKIKEIVRKRNLYPFLDTAYQGFATGDPEADAAAVRLFDDGAPNGFILAQSFAKNFGLYGERVGLVTVVGSSEEESARLMSQMKILVRPMYSNPPIHGARLVGTVLGDATLNALWREEVKGLADRILSMRKALRNELENNLKSTLPWNHVTSQIGMFCFTGLSKDEVNRMIKEFHIYMTADGRISIPGLTTKNVGYVANALHECTKNRKK